MPEARKLVMQGLYARIRHPLKVLRAAFPDYDGYSKRTARVIPGIY